MSCVKELKFFSSFSYDGICENLLETVEKITDGLENKLSQSYGYDSVYYGYDELTCEQRT